MFPDDFHRLKGLIEHWRITRDHTDDAAFARWGAR